MTAPLEAICRQSNRRDRACVDPSRGTSGAVSRRMPFTKLTALAAVTAQLGALLGGCVIGDSATHATSQTVRAPSLLGLNVPADGSGLAIASDLGARWVRLELVDGSFDVDLDAGVADRLRATLDDYHARGTSVLLLVDYASLGGNAGFGDGRACGDWEGWRAMWLARIEQVARTLGDRIDGWEIWNEPDQPILGCGSGDYNPGVPAADYGVLLRDAYTRLRDAGAAAPIVVGGLDSGQVSYVSGAAAAAGGLFADAVAIHPYGVVPDDRWCPGAGDGLDCSFGTLGGKVDEYSAATGLSVWITELGINTTDTQHAADYLSAAYTALASRDAVTHVFYFCESDAMVAPFGLTFADGSPKPALYAAYQALSADAITDHTAQLHGAVQAAGVSLQLVWVSAWGQSSGDFHVTFTDGLGIYEFTDLDPSSRYNVAVNTQFDPGSPTGFRTVEPAHDFTVRNNVELVSGPDGWHGENFDLAF